VNSLFKNFNLKAGEVMLNEILDFITSFNCKYDFKGTVIGISGGLDSAVTACLCAKALGAQNVYGLILPERDSSKKTLKDALKICDFLKIPHKVHKISGELRHIGAYKLQPPAFFIPSFIKEKYAKKNWESLGKENIFFKDLSNSGDSFFLKGLAYYRAKHRIRMCKFYLEAEKRGYSVVGTTNKTEFLTGLYVKYGDDSVDYEPIFHLYKTQVIELAKKLSLPDFIIEKKPSPDLIPGIDDEYIFSMNYYDLDRLLIKINNKESLDNENQDLVKRIKKIIEYAKFREIKSVHL
jgi:NAD+ synthase